MYLRVARTDAAFLSPLSFVVSFLSGGAGLFRLRDAQLNGDNLSIVIEILEDVSKSKIKWLPCQVSNDLKSRSGF